MNVQIDHRSAAYSRLALQDSNCNGDVIEQTETFAVIRERVMKSTADMNAKSPLAPQACRRNGASSHQSETFDNFPGARKLELRDFFGGESARAGLVEIVVRMDQGELFPRRGSRLNPLPSSRGGQLAVQSLVFCRWKYVGTDVDAVARRADDLHATASAAACDARRAGLRMPPAAMPAAGPHRRFARSAQ